MFRKFFYIVTFIALSMLSNVAIAQANNQFAPPSAEDFAMTDDRSFAISKDGKKIVFFSGDGVNDQIILYDVDTQQEKPINIGNVTKPRSVYWLDNDHLIIDVSFAYSEDKYSRKNDYKYEIYRSFSYSVSKKTIVALMPDDKLIRNTNLPIIYTDKINNKIIMAGSYIIDGEFVLALFLTNLDTGKGKEILKGNSLTEAFYLDKNGNPRLRIDVDARSKNVKLFDITNKQKKLLVDVKDDVELPFSIEGFLDDNTILILQYENNKSVAKKYNIQTGEIKDYFNDEKRNISNIITDPHTNEPLGIAFEGYSKEVRWLNEKLEKSQKLLAKTFSNQNVSIVDWDENYENLLVSAVAGNHKNQVYLYQTKSKSASGLASMPDSFYDYEFPVKTLEKFKASDGLEIPVFITRPKNPNGKKLPAILFPHGGPRARDDISFDYMAQFLATRGYIIIQPQFRGSTGNGIDFINAGYGEWAGKMQTDTIESLDYAISKGDIDKNRVCIVGASYGGYSALVGIAQDAEKLKCAISYGGISDLAAMQITDENRDGGISSSVVFWREHIGVTRYDSKKIHAISPLYMVDKIKAPVLLMHGTDDTVVMPEQSKKMYNALKKAGKDVKYIELKDEDHWLSREKTRAQFLKEMENFLAPILKPQE